MPTTPLSHATSHFAVRWNIVTGKVECPLQRLVQIAKKSMHSRAGQHAIVRLGPKARGIVLHFADQNRPFDEKLASTPGITKYLHNSQCTPGVSSVLAFSILARYDEYLQQAWQKAGLRRSYVNKTKTDLLHELRLACLAHDDLRLVTLIFNEACLFIDIVDDAALEATIWHNLDAFVAIAVEPNK